MVLSKNLFVQVCCEAPLSIGSIDRVVFASSPILPVILIVSLDYYRGEEQENKYQKYIR